jgi:hypothetical protein
MKMKRNILILISAMGVLLCASCEKCVTCSYQAIGLPVYSSEYCSKRSKDIDAFKKSVSESAQIYGTSATCVDKK